MIREVEVDPGADPLRATVERIDALVRDRPDRVVVGFVGPPGSGKSTVVAQVAALLGADRCVVVPMDGFHLANRLIAGTSLADRKGAVDTFDASGYVHLLERLRSADEPVVYAPAYERSIEEPVAGAIAIPASTPIVLTEGNYLLVDAAPWDRVRSLLDATWYIEVAEELRHERLVRRHIEFGKAPDAALAWALGPDQRNARFIERTRYNADHILYWR